MTLEGMDTALEKCKDSTFISLLANVEGRRTQAENPPAHYRSIIIFQCKSKNSQNRMFLCYTERHETFYYKLVPAVYGFYPIS